MGALFRLVGTVVIVVVVVGVVLVGLSFAGAPTPTCGAGAVATSQAAEDSFNGKWSDFDAALQGGGPATVTLTQEELTSRGAAYLLEQGLPARDLQVHLCPGQGKGQASLKMTVQGREVAVLATGHLDVSSQPSRVVVDSLQVGLLPEQVGTLVANRLLEALSLRPGGGIREVTTTATEATLQGQK